MQIDIIDLRKFYETPLGKITQRIIERALEPLLEKTSHKKICGYGYTLPYLNAYHSQTSQSCALMPSAQGVTGWPEKKANATALIDDNHWPLANETLDYILMIHALEMSENPSDVLKEVWRTLKPGGKLILCVPHRLSYWAPFENTPFGHGHPFSHSQLTKLLKENNLTYTQSIKALYCLPSTDAFLLKIAQTLEYCGMAFWPAFGGILIMEATKTFQSGTTAPIYTRKLVLTPPLKPQTV